MNTLERQKQKIKDRFEEGIGVHPFLVLYDYTYQCWKQERNDTTEMARQIMYRAEVCGRPNPGRNNLEESFEQAYLEKPRQAIQALELILGCPTETGYKEYVEEKKKAALEGRFPKYNALFKDYGVPEEVLKNE